jgi:hypothetical protein
MAILLEHYRRHYNHQEQMKRLQKAKHEFGCGESILPPIV